MAQRVLRRGPQNLLLIGGSAVFLEWCTPPSEDRKGFLEPPEPSAMISLYEALLPYLLWIRSRRSRYRLFHHPAFQARSHCRDQRIQDSHPDKGRALHREGFLLGPRSSSRGGSPHRDHCLLAPLSFPRKKETPKMIGKFMKRWE